MYVGKNAKSCKHYYKTNKLNYFTSLNFKCTSKSTCSMQMHVYSLLNFELSDHTRSSSNSSYVPGPDEHISAPLLAPTVLTIKELH